MLTDVVQVLLDPESADASAIIVDLRTHPWALVLSQDCDLDWDYQARTGTTEDYRRIPSVLLCEVITAQQLRDSDEINSTIWTRVKGNNDERYHFLQQIQPESDARGEGLPELAVDFKRYFTISTDRLYATLGNGVERRCRLVTPYRDHFSTRFTRFMSRIALPNPHFSEPVQK